MGYGDGGGRYSKTDIRKFSRVMEMFIVFIVMVVLQDYAYVKTHQTVTLNGCCLLYVHYASIKRFLKMKKIKGPQEGEESSLGPGCSERLQM